MKQTFLLTALLFSAITAIPAMAGEDFHALRQLQTQPTPMAKEKLAAIEGGQFNPMNINVSSIKGDGFSLVSVDVSNIGNIKLNIAVLTQTNACGICSGDLSNIGGIGQQ